MFWAAGATDVSKSRLVFIDEGLKVIRQVYLNISRKKKFFLGSQKTFGKKLNIHTAHTAVLESLNVSEAEVDRIRRVS